MRVSHVFKIVQMVPSRAKFTYIALFIHPNFNDHLSFKADQLLEKSQ